MDLNVKYKENGLRAPKNTVKVASGDFGGTPTGPNFVLCFIQPTGGTQKNFHEFWSIFDDPLIYIKGSK